MFSNDLQPSKDELLISVVIVGIDICLKDLHFLNVSYLTYINEKTSSRVAFLSVILSNKDYNSIEIFTVLYHLQWTIEYIK